MILGGNMNLRKHIYIGKYWIPFPSSEYGGNWVVIAKDRDEVASLLRSQVSDLYEQYDENMLESIRKAESFALASDIIESKVVVTFFT
jgi:hypothetical protein